MKKLLRKTGVFAFLLIVIFLLTMKKNESKAVVVFIAVLCSMVASVLDSMIELFFENFGQLKLAFWTHFWHRKQKIRMSMAYVYIIRVKDKYLLVKNTHSGYYQPVGGVYKVIGQDIGFLKDRFTWEPDKHMKTTDKKKNDLRGHIPAPKVIDFLQWFNAGTHREASHWREFYEELVATKILERDEFPYVEYRFKGNLTTSIHKSQHFGCYEIQSFDVYELLPTDPQEKELVDLQSKEHGDYKWVSDSLIQNLGHDNSSRSSDFTIAEHTKWTLNMKID